MSNSYAADERHGLELRTLPLDAVAHGVSHGHVATESDTSAARVSVFIVRALADVLRQRGFAPERVLGAATELLYVEPLEGRIPLVDYQALFVRAMQLTDDPALGLHCGFYAAESSFGLLSPLITHAPTLRHAFQLLAQFHPLLLEGTRMHLTESMGTATVRWEFPLVNALADRSLAEFSVAGLVRTLRGFGCSRSDIYAVCFEHARPVHHHEYSAAFFGAERFSRSFTGIEFSAQALDRPHLHVQPEIEGLLRAQAERTMERLRKPLSSTDQVLAIMRRQRRGHALEMSWVAREIGLSSRSLRRRLLDEGTSYRALAQSVLHDVACTMLRDPSITLQSIAHTLGFADSTAFHRAFKRWTRLTPRQYRESPTWLEEQARDGDLRPDHE
ncbi:MAG: AraC family transcriptional regulator ligand-binding domain-containing protein [Polyangiales bacterium]